MIGIIQDWLFHQLGINVDFDEFTEKNIFKDGVVLVDILKKYGLINQCLDYVISTNNNIQCKKNLSFLKPLFNMLKVNYNDSIILDIVEGKLSTVMKLLYELYVCLENKQHLYFIKQMFYETVQSNIIESSTIGQLNENIKSKTSIQPEYKCFEKSFLKNKDVISWYESKCRDIKNNLDAKLMMLKNDICQEIILGDNDDKRDCPCNNVNNTTLRESLPNLNMYPTFQNHDKLLNHDEFIIHYKNKIKQKIAKKHFENELQNEILNKTWMKIKNNQNILHNNIYSEILLKQSQYEKQILNKLISTQKQIKVQDENHNKVNNLVLSEFGDQVNSDLKLKEDFLELEFVYRNEQKRVLDLHKKIYKEKQDFKKKVTVTICNDIIKDLTDIAFVASDYKLKYGEDVSRNMWNNWMKLFIKGKPVHIPFENLTDTVTHVSETEYDDIIRFERNQDELLNETDVEEYLLTCGKWFFKDICLEGGTNNDNVISFIVHRLLSLKYPPPEYPSAANIPSFKSATILLNFYDSSSIDKLKMLLSKRKIHVFDTETAIIKSVNAFKKETSPLIEEKLKSNRKKSGGKIKRSKPKVLEKSQTDTISNKLKKNGKAKKQSDLQALKVETLVENINNLLIDKETQTSFVDGVQENVLIRTELGLIGEEVSKLLSEGKEVVDSLVVKVIIEYLKTIDDFEGWLLLNYPNTLYQASELELALTGKILPLDDCIVTEEYDLNTNRNNEVSSIVRSKLYPFPEISKDDNKFATYFSQIITTNQTKNQNIETRNKHIKHDRTQSEETVNYEEKLLDTDRTIAYELLKMFYYKHNVFKEFKYDITSLSDIKMLARLILNEDCTNATDSIELFGEEIINKLSNIKSKTKKTKVTSGKNRSKFISKIKGSKTIIDTSDQKQAVLDGSSIKPTETVPVNDTELLKQQTIEPSIVNPGEHGWEYITLPIDNQMAVLLADIWENIENFYLSLLKDVFFQNRMINLRLIPYSSYAREELNKIINKPDIKEDIVNYFTKYYNSIDKNLRTLPDVKSQLHCKVLEMQEDLWKTSDNDKMEIEARRQQLIRENWVANELCLLVNNYLCLIQCETDRTVETFKIIQNYYLSTLYECPPPAGNTQISQPLLEKINTNTFLNSNKMSTSLPDIKDPDIQISDQSNDNIIISCLINCSESDSIFTLFSESLLKELNKAKHETKNIFDTLLTQITFEEKILSSTNKGKILKDTKTKNENVKPESITNEKSNKKNITKLSKDLKVDDEIESKKKLLLLEWQFALSNEEKRFINCLELIRKKAEENIMEFYCYLENVFCQLHDSALSKYDNEILNVNKLCEYLHTAIEEETPLIYPPMLTKGTFCTNKTGYVKPKQEKYELNGLTEETSSCYFTIKQLSKLIDIFKIAGPFGVIRKQPFCYILQDLLLFNSDDNKPHLPDMWHCLNESQLRDVIQNTFGTVYAVDWRDFIIYNLEIPYPSITDILNLKKSFLFYDLKENETISKDDYEKVILWFEIDLPSNPTTVLKLAMIKELLFELFKVNEGFTNYTTLLLYFCKDYEPHNGLKKALCLSFGKLVITTEDELKETIKNDIEKKDHVQILLGNIINGVVMNREGVLIYEIYDVPSELSINDDANSNNSKSTASELLSNTISRSVSHESAISKLKEDKQIHEESSREADGDVFEKSWISRIPVATVVSVLNNLFHNQDKTYDLRNLYLSCLEEEADPEGMIEGHVLMASSSIQKLFNTTNKFKICSSCHIIQ